MLLAEKLLKTCYELENLVQRSGWQEEKLAGNPPRHIRYQQIQAMMKFLNYRGNPVDLFRDTFSNRSEKEKKRIIVELNNLQRLTIQTDPFVSMGDVQATFWYLYQWRCRFHNCFDVFFISAGVGNYSIGENMLVFLSQNLPKNIVWVDKMLYCMVDPESNIFDYHLLNWKYGYPDADIYKIDEEWI